jgi:glycosyltransferase involved in cell wall biosynthesis
VNLRRVVVMNKYHFISGGAERYYLSVMDAMRRRGVEPVPFSIRYPRTAPGPYQEYFVEPAVRSPEAKIQNQRPTFGEQLALARQAIYNTAAKNAVRRIGRDLRPDAAYLLNINNHLSPSVIDACWELGIPVVMRLSDFNLVCAANMYYRDGHPCTDCKRGLHHAVLHRCVHGSVVRSAVAVFANSLHRMTGVYRKVSAFVAPSRFMKRDLEELGFPPRIVHQINTFVEPRAPGGPDLERPYVLFVGRFAGYKGVHLAVEAFLRAAPEGVELRLLGDEGDADARALRARAEASGAKGVRILPFERDPQKVEEAVRGSLFTVVPSIFYENLPHAILESFACGRTVVATRLGSIPEVVREGENGLLFAPGDLDEFAAKIRTLCADRALRERLGRAARETIVRDYSEEGHMEKLFGVFEGVLAERAEKAPA